MFSFWGWLSAENHFHPFFILSLFSSLVASHSFLHFSCKVCVCVLMLMSHTMCLLSLYIGSSALFIHISCSWNILISFLLLKPSISHNGWLRYGGDWEKRFRPPRRHIHAGLHEESPTSLQEREDIHLHW